MNETAQQAIARCYELLHTQPAPFRNLWTQAEPNERRIFCIVAGVPVHNIDRDWLGLSIEHRAQITHRVKGMKDWLNRKLGK